MSPLGHKKGDLCVTAETQTVLASSFRFQGGDGPILIIGSLFWQYLVWYDNCRAATNAHDRQGRLSREEVQDLCNFCHLGTKQKDDAES